LDEIGYAIDNSKRFLPVLLEPCEVPLRLRRFQYVDFTNKDFDDGVESAKDLLRALIAQTTVPRGTIGTDQKSEADRKTKEEADRLAAQKAEADRKAKSEIDRKAKEEADRLAAQKAEADRKAKSEIERKAKEEADHLAAQKARVTPPEAAPVSPPPPKKTASRSLVFGIIGVVVLVVCGIGYGVIAFLGNTTATEPPVVSAVTSTKVQASATAAVSVSTSTPKPTETVKPTVQATQTQTKIPAESVQSRSFTLKFDENTKIDNFEYFENGAGDESKVNITPSNDGLEFKLNDQDLYVYYVYKSDDYEDVVVRLRAENIGTINTNNISLVCRKNGETWYEFSVTSGGLWYLYDHNTGNYNTIGNGGTTALKLGQAINDYEMRCVGNTISLFVNGQEVRTVTSDLYTKGQVGFNISSLDVFPIEILVSEFEVSER
jgi:hypothetical protein